MIQVCIVTCLALTENLYNVAQEKYQLKVLQILDKHYAACQQYITGIP